MREAKKQTSGVMASSIIHSLCDTVFLHACNEKRREASENLEKHAISEKVNGTKKIQWVKMLREKYGHESKHLFEPFSKDECSTQMQYKKQPNKDAGCLKTYMNDKLAM